MELQETRICQIGVSSPAKRKASAQAVCVCLQRGNSLPSKRPGSVSSTWAGFYAWCWTNNWLHEVMPRSAFNDSDWARRRFGLTKAEEVADGCCFWLNRIYIVDIVQSIVASTGRFHPEECKHRLCSQRGRRCVQQLSASLLAKGQS